MEDSQEQSHTTGQLVACAGHKVSWEQVLGAQALERLRHLDNASAATQRVAGTTASTGKEPTGFTDVTCDVVLLGGGLSLLHAPLLAHMGLKVAVLERSQAGCGHREWNASWQELMELVRLQLVSEAQLTQLVVARYSHGICRWHEGHTTSVTDVLDCAVDATALLAHARSLAQQRGVLFFDHTEVLHVWPDANGVTIDAQTRHDGVVKQPLRLRAHLALEARGAALPGHTADLICPTVGGVLEDLEEGTGLGQQDSKVGDILATCDHVEEGRQHLWEAFPNRAGQTSVYLFYYAERHTLGPKPLARLYERFAATLPRFKRGKARLIRPTFGLIPGWSRLTPAPRSGHPRVILVGDAAARHSPLTFCGFGAMLRSIQQTLNTVALLHKTPRPSRELVAVSDRPVHGITGALSLLLARTPPRADALNALLDAAFLTLAQMGQQHYRALLRDEMPPAQVLRFLWQTSRSHSDVWRTVWQGLGAKDAVRWGGRTMLRAF